MDADKRPVTKSVTPRGVEHSLPAKIDSRDQPVTKSVTPRGVEHPAPVIVEPAIGV